jgi:hypothetical protein
MQVNSEAEFTASIVIGDMIYALLILLSNRLPYHYHISPILPHANTASSAFRKKNSSKDNDSRSHWLEY